MSASIKYRPEIDGLRALAVISVIIFHVESKWLPGGFVGVDIFFVISGYLISTIILNELNAGNFSLINFYTRRLKRILPAFYLVLIVTIIFGYLLLQPKDILYLNDSVKNVIFFWGNIFFARSGDYFSLQSSEIPLLHLWSLSVEEQFYFIWPAINIFLFRFRKGLVILPFFILISSFLIAEYLLISQKHLSFAYYSLVTRSGELLVGYIIAVIMQKKLNLRIYALESYSAPLGIFFIFLSLFLLDKNSKFPGINALFVCIGTAMIIYNSNHKSSLIYRVLTSRVFVLIGKMSYSLYLWHWPILAYMRYVYGSYSLPLEWLIIALILTVLFSIISYLFIESKIRCLNLNFRKSFLSFYIAPSISILLLINLLNTTSLIKNENLDPLYTTYGDENICHGKIQGHCVLGDKSKKSKILVMGDSHTAHYNYFFEELGQKCGWSATVLSASSCSAVLGCNELLLPEWAQESCKNLTSYVWSHYTEYEVIIISLRWEFHLDSSGKEGIDPNFLEKLEATLARLSKGVKHVYVLSQIPLLSNSPVRTKKFIKFGLNIAINNSNSALDIANNKIKELTKKYTNVTWVEMGSLFKYFDNGFLYKDKPVYMDNNHLNQYGARILAELFYKNYLVDHQKNCLCR